MLERFFRRDTHFFDLFAKHAELTVAAAKEFRALAENEDDIAARAKRITDLEHECDAVTHQCVEELHKAFRPPLGRDAVYRLITRLDDVVDYIEAASDRIALYGITKMTPEARGFGQILVSASEELEIALRELRYLRGPREVLQRCVEINRLENEADALLRKAVAKLFRDATDVRDLIKWKEIYENLEDATDRCEDVANIIESVILDND